MSELLDDSVPVGFGLALAQNPEAIVIFGRLPKEKREEIISRARSAQNKAEMRSIVSEIKTNATQAKTGGAPMD